MSDNFWRNHNFRLEPWGNDYEPPINLSEALSASESEVDPTVETRDWGKRKPQQPPKLPDCLIFIDGRRRIDAALIGGTGDTVAYGAFGTIAVGTVVVDRVARTATCSQLTIRRVLGFGGNQEAPLTRIPCPLGSKAELVYEPVAPNEENNPQVGGLLMQQVMLGAEAQLAAALAIEQNTLVIRDGRLPYNSLPFTLGYVKTMHKNYLSEKYAALLWELSPGERSPIFAIKEQNRPRWSWYLKSGDSRICPNHLGYHGLHGIVRLELFADLPLETAQEIADQSTYLIPEYASQPHKDPRAPQNLAPVGALERELGRRMGDAVLIKRRVQHFLASVGAIA